MDQIGDILQKTLNKRGLQKQAQSSLVVHLAQKWLKTSFPDLENQLKVKKFQDFKLVIESQSAIASHEIHLKKQFLHDFLQKELNNIHLEEIIVRRSSS